MIFLKRFFQKNSSNLIIFHYKKLELKLTFPFSDSPGDFLIVPKKTIIVKPFKFFSKKKYFVFVRWFIALLKEFVVV